MVGFNFMGSGVDTKATAIILTPYYVKIIQFCLKGMGTTSKAEIVIYEKGLLVPLMSKKNYERWAQKYLQSLTKVKDLYGASKRRDVENGSDSVSSGDNDSGTHEDTDSIPSGIVALCKIFVSNRGNFFGHQEVESNELGEQLGFGSFGITYKHKADSSQVVKVARYGLKAEFEREASILSQLKGVEGAVQLVNQGQITIKIGEVPVVSMGLFLSPVGIPIEVYLSDYNGEDRSTALLASVNQICVALGAIHSKGIFHNDVSPKNIMIEDTDEDAPKAFLIDFGMSTLRTEQNKGYMGTPRFSPLSVFEQYPSKEWYSTKDTDLSALALSAAWLMKKPGGGDCPWKSIEPCAASDEVWKMAHTRLEIAVGLLKKEVHDDISWFWDALEKSSTTTGVENTMRNGLSQNQQKRSRRPCY
jgi:serine/threonine protein kinase